MASAVQVLPPSLTGSRKDSSKAKKSEEWFNICLGTVKSMHEALSYLYDGVEEDIEKTNGRPERMGEQTLSQVACTFDRSCQTLALILSTPANGQVRIPLASILQEISRCLKVSYSDVKSVPSLTELAQHLPCLHQSALHVLSQLIICCKSNLLTHSKTVTEVCLHALTSTRHMEASVKSQTRACVYQTLCLWVENFGWRNSFMPQAKSTFQELISDIQLGDSLKQVTSNVTTQNDDQGQRRKGRKKKKNKAESYSDLAVDASTSDGNANSIPASSMKATVGALELSRLTLDRVEFASVENLMRCILDTASTIQRERAPVSSPYSQTKCRKKLYKAVISCRTVRLEASRGRKDTVIHFQLSNLAMSLLNVGCHQDSSYQVQKTCREALNNVRLNSNLNRPIVRRILPDDKFEQKDSAELERDLDRLVEENESLRKRLLDSEIEKQGQSRVIASLRHKVEVLKTQAKKSDSQPADDNLKSSRVDDVLNTDERKSSESDSEEETEKIGSVAAEAKQNIDLEEEERFKDSNEPRNEEKAANENEMKKQQTRVVKESGNLVVAEEISQKASKNDSSGKKRPLNVLEESKGQKKPKTDIGSSSSQLPNSSGSPRACQDDSSDPDSVQAMISDFVDADADLF